MDDDGDAHDEYEDDDGVEEHDEWVAERQREPDEEMRKIETNDPTFTTLKIYSYGLNIYNWGKLGTAIGRNTHLTTIKLKNFTTDTAIKFRDFARGLALNRSVKKLTIGGWDQDSHTSDEAWEYLTQFFIDNEAFECLELDLHRTIRYEKLATSLRRFHSLKEFKLFNQSARNSEACVDDIIEYLIEHHICLRKVTISDFHIGTRGCSALATSSLTELHLQYCPHVNEEGVRAFAAGLARNTTLKVLEIRFDLRKITEIGWQLLFNAFATCKVESLILDSNELNDTTIHPLSNALLHNTTLKSLSLSNNFAITNAGWVIFSTSLRGIMLEKLSICGNLIVNIGITVIAESLENNSSLRELCLSDNLIGEDGVSALCTVLQHPNSVLEKLDIYDNSIGDIGVTAISTILRHPNSTLEKLDISKNYIGDIGMNALTDALLNNSMLKELLIEENPDITTAGWMNFSTILRNPTSALEVIVASHDSINDEVVHSFADALSENKTLEELYLGICPPEYGCKITSYGYAAMNNMLCNTSSILNTFNSNHTLEMLCYEFDEFDKNPLPFESSLKINRENSVSAAARLKIINTHFSGSEINMRPFVEMNLSVRPHAIAWMARDENVYELLRAMPSLLDQFEDSGIRSKKRTRKI
jgi:Ran GTPase-activating protein (RanGAP) involved in mRNA processing and transport